LMLGCLSFQSTLSPWFIASAIISLFLSSSFFFQAEDGIRDFHVTGVQTCALPICTTRKRFRVGCHVAQEICAGSNANVPAVPVMERCSSCTDAQIGCT